MNYTAWADAHLTHTQLHQKGHKTSIWHTPRADKPLLVLVHGINGNHFGLVPLAAELSEEYQIVIVELPGHGNSDFVELPSAHALQKWFKKTLAQIEASYDMVATVCAHSFGCSAVLDEQVLKTREVLLLNPVPVPSELYIRYSRMIMDSAHFWAHIYNWRVFIFMRGLVLAKTHGREAMRRVRWVGWQAQPTYQQIVYQAGLVDIILDKSAYEHTATGDVALVVCGMADTTASQRDFLDMKTVFDGTRTVFLSGGHLLPIESPARVAEVIREAVVR